MTDRYKGFLVILDKEMRDDDAESTISAISMIRNVHSVKPYVKSSEDYMTEYKTRDDTYCEILKYIFEKRKEKT